MSFVSANVLKAQREEKKEQKRISRQKILEEAKEKFYEEKKRQELKRERGDDVWVAPGINKRLNLNKKPKKHKKEKKKKQSKEHKKKDHVSDEGNSSEEEWVEKNENEEEEPLEAIPIQETTPIQRDEWMTLPLGPSLSSKKRLEELTDKNEVEDENEVTIDKPGRHPLELNPYWKDGGSGLPEDRFSPVRKVGDGGRSWLLRAYKRALERVENEGKNLEEIASHQWGSLDKLYSLLKDAGIDPNYPDKPVTDKKRLYSRMEPHSQDKRHHRDRSPPRRAFIRPSSPPKERNKRKGGFIRPSDNDETIMTSPSSTLLISNISESSSWRKKTVHDSKSPPHSRSSPSPVPSSSQNVHSSPPRSLNDPSRHTSQSSALPPHDEDAPVITSTQLNSLAAKLIKAELLGDQKKIDKLKKEMKLLQEQKEQQEQKSSYQKETPANSEDEKVIVLTKTDRYGNTRPLERPSSSDYNNSRHTKREPRGSTHTEKGKRKKYFADDDQYSLKALVEQERLSTADDTHAAIARMASKFVPSSMGDETVDDALESASVMKHNPRKEEDKAQRRAISDNRKMTEALDNCKLCFDNSGFDKHLLIAVGLNVYLSLPSVQSLTEGHCLIVPMEHTSSILQVDENIWSEINIFRKGLTRLFSDRGMDVVFMEMSTRTRSHTVIECIPLPQDIGQMAPMYFKKAIQEGDREWSDNKKVIDTSKKGVRNSLPVGLPYFFVEFGTDGGYAHIVEDSTKFPYYFGKEVCGGMLDVEPRLWLKPHRESFERQKEKVIQFSEWWVPYDWTQKLKEDQ